MVVNTTADGEDYTITVEDSNKVFSFEIEIVNNKFSKLLPSTIRPEAHSVKGIFKTLSISDEVIQQFSDDLKQKGETSIPYVEAEVDNKKRYLSHEQPKGICKLYKRSIPTIS